MCGPLSEIPLIHGRLPPGCPFARDGVLTRALSTPPYEPLKDRKAVFSQAVDPPARGLNHTMAASLLKGTAYITGAASGRTIPQTLQTPVSNGFFQALEKLPASHSQNTASRTSPSRTGTKLTLTKLSKSSKINIPRSKLRP